MTIVDAFGRGDANSDDRAVAFEDDVVRTDEPLEDVVRTNDADDDVVRTDNADDVVRTNDAQDGEVVHAYDYDVVRSEDTGTVTLFSFCIFCCCYYFFYFVTLCFFSLSLSQYFIAALRTDANTGTETLSASGSLTSDAAEADTAEREDQADYALLTSMNPFLAVMLARPCPRSL